MLSLLLALALVQTDPAAAAPALGAVSGGQDVSNTSKGAPADDYGFVAWCHGALTGHMALYEQVKPELVSIEQPNEVETDAKNDKLQMQAGRDYLALYTRALDGVDHGRPGALTERRKAAEAQGVAIWDPFRDVPARARMWAWVGWDLPGRCETASHKLLTPAGRRAALRSPAPDAAGPASIDDALTPGPPPADSGQAPPAAAPPTDAAPGAPPPQFERP